jgi:T-complex protein 1 subunit eta
MHSQIIIKGYRAAVELCVNHTREISYKIDASDKDEHYQTLLRCAQTSLNSKIIARYREFFGKMVVDAVLHLDEN